MRKSLAAACSLMILWFCGCRVPEREQVTHLVDQFSYTDAWTFIGRRADDAFQLNLKSPAQKFPAIVQKQPGAIAFYLWPASDSRIRLRTSFEQRQASELDARMVLEGDYPVAHRQEYPVTPGAVVEIPIRETPGPIRLVLQARCRNRERLGGLLYWIDPVLCTTPHGGTSQDEPLPAFRSRNANRNVLVLLLDAANWSHFGYAGYPKPTTPRLDRVARDGVVFTNAVAPACYTLASTGSLFTGLYPPVHGVFERGAALHESFRTLAESLRDGGWRTALFSANPNVSAATGYDQGFQDVWDSGVRHRVDADEIADAAIEWLGRVRDRRFFGYVHFREPHAPYTPPRDYLERFGADPDAVLPAFDKLPEPDAETKKLAGAAYDANLAYVDAQAGRILDRLRELDLDSNTIVIILADHGEAFWEHGIQGHNAQVYQEMTRIPLVMSFPGEEALRGKRVDHLTGTIDLFPTLVDLFRLSNKNLRHNGRSMLPFLLHNIAQGRRLLLSHNSASNSFALSSRDLKFVLTKWGQTRRELFLLPEDPGEQNNVLEKYPLTARFFELRLQQELEMLRNSGQALRRGRERKAKIDAEMEEQLRALGYIQ